MTKKNKPKFFFTLTFTYTFEYDNDNVFFAYSCPYTYSQLQKDIEKVKGQPHKNLYNIYIYII